MRYLPVTDEEKKEMLTVISAQSTDNLFHVIPDEFYLRNNMSLELPLGEADLEFNRGD
jgi:glycine cleavage system pyridoxal-binding protein P